MSLRHGKEASVAVSWKRWERSANEMVSSLKGEFRMSYAPHMEVHMELSKKTTILFSPELHERLARLAEQRRTSIGDLVRTAVEQQYGLVSKEERLAAVSALGELNLPVGSPEEMEMESVPTPEEILG